MKTYLSPVGPNVATLEAVLMDWGLSDDSDVLFDAWKMFDRTGGVVLPESGGFLDQDQRIMQFFEAMFLLKAFHSIPQSDTQKLGNDW